MNAVVKESHIETIYDHNVMDDELTALFGDPDERLSKEDYIDMRDDLNSACADLYKLYKLRKNADTAQRFLNYISDATYRRCVAQPFCTH
jgi:hypothetical protein